MDENLHITIVKLIWITYINLHNTDNMLIRENTFIQNMPRLKTQVKKKILHLNYVY